MTVASGDSPPRPLTYALYVVVTDGLTGSLLSRLVFVIPPSTQ